MRAISSILMGLLLCLIVGAVIWLGHTPPDSPPHGGTATLPVYSSTRPGAWRMGIVPERDVFVQRNRFRVLADYLEKKLGKGVDVVTLNTYEGVVEEFEQGRLDFAVAGALLVVLLVDRDGAQVISRPVLDGGVDSYRGVIIVREGAAIGSVEDLAGRRIALLRATYAGDLYPMMLMKETGLLGSSSPPRIMWAGTHEEVVRAVVDGSVDAGAVKDLVLNDLLKAHPDWKVRVLAASPPAPNMTVVVRRDLAGPFAEQLRRGLSGMGADAEGQAALRRFGAQGFEPCDLGQFGAVYDMVQRVGDSWERLGISGPPPRRPDRR